MAAELLRSGKQELSTPYWDLTGDFPVPTMDFRCPVCGAGDSLLFRSVRFHRADWSPVHKYRCQVSLKCGDTPERPGCGFVLMFGVIVPEEMYRKNPGRQFYRAELQNLLESGA